MMCSIQFQGLDPGCPPALLSLQRHIRPTFMDFNKCSKKGDLWIHHSIAKETEQIFEVIFKMKFPIFSMKSLDEFIDLSTGRWCDYRSMEANNCSGFHYRKMFGKAKLSYHAVGLAIDINPLINPFIKGDLTIPDKAEYRPGLPGVFYSEHPVVKLFEDFGWTWGGNFQELKDYHHFQKYHPDLTYWENQMKEFDEIK